MGDNYVRKCLRPPRYRTPTMAEKAIGAALRAPRKQTEELSQELAANEQLFQSGVEHELQALIAQYGPDPERIVALLGEKAPWQRRRAAERLAADYGQETADILLRCAANRAIFDNHHPVIERLRGASKRGPKGHGLLLAEALKRRARGQRAKLPENLRARTRALPESVRVGLERTVGESASNIRVLADHEAGEAVRAVGAVAATTEGIILLSEGRFRPDTAEGQELLAHEAVHALQQRGGDGSGLSSGAAEHEADAIAAEVVAPQEGAARMPIAAPVGRQAIARKTDAGAPAAATKKTLTFKLGQTTAKATLDVPGGDAASGSGTTVKSSELKLSDLNALLPEGIKFTDATVKVKINGEKLGAAVTIKAKYEGKAPYLKPVDFTFKCDTEGNLSAKVKLELDIPGFCNAKSDDIVISKEGIDAEIKITTATFKIPGVGGEGGLTVAGELTAKVKKNQLESIDGEANLTLPDGFGTAKISAQVAGGKLGEVTADVKSSAIPGLGTVSCKLKWSEKGGFELDKLDVPVTAIPGIKGKVVLSYKKGKGFAVDGKDIKFTAKALEKLEIKKVTIDKNGLAATVKIAGVSLEVPGWLKITGLKGTVELKGASVACKDVGGNVAVADGKAKGTFTASLVDGEFKAKGKITTLTVAPKIITIGAGGLAFDIDVGGESNSAEVTGTIAIKLGTLATGKIEKVGFKDGYFTGKGELPFTKGVLKGLKISVELLAASPFVKAEIDAKNLVGKKLDVSVPGPYKVDVTCTKANLKLSGDLSDVEGTIGGSVKVDGGKLAEGDFELKAEKGNVEGDLKVKVKEIPGLKMKGGEFKLHVKNDKITTGSGDATFTFEKFVKGDVKVAYSTAKGFSIEGKGLTVDIPGFPFDIKPFDVAYADGKFSAKNVTGVLKPGKVPGVQTATVVVNFVDNKLKIELKDVAFTIPQLKKTSLSAKWDDGKWEVAGEADLDLPKGLKCKAKFGADNGKGNDLNFNCSIELSTTELKKIIPGVEVTSGKITFKYQDGKLTCEGGELGLKLANGVLAGSLKFTLNEDKTFNATGKFKLTLKFIKAKEIEVKVTNNVLERVAVTGLELDLPAGKGKGALTGDASYDNGKFNCALTAQMTDLPWVAQASATVVIKDGKWEKFEATGQLKKTPGIDLSGIKFGGKLAGGEPSFFADGTVPITGIKDPLKFHLLISASKFEVGLEGSFEIKGLGKATVKADLSNDGFRAELTIAPTNTKLVKKASGFIEYKGGTLTFGGEVTIVIAKEFEGSVKFAKLADGDFEFKGTIKPTSTGGGESKKKKLFYKAIEPPGVAIPYGIPGLLDVHIGAGVKGSLEAGIYMPAFKFLGATVSGKLSELEKGDLPNAEVRVQASAGAYAEASLGARVYVGASVLGASLDLQGEATAKLEAKAMINAAATLVKDGSNYKFTAELNAELGAALKLAIGLALVLKFVGAELWRHGLASKELALGEFNLGKFPLKKLEYTFGGPKKEPAKEEVTPPEPKTDIIKNAGLEMGKQKAAEAKDEAIRKVKESKAYKAAAAVANAASKAWNFVTSW
ncbi:MAG: DUF4157 domain-containing protein [Myxococcales bacterium]|nr:DUF4157 domain-containing protein [Myxococcales bacterium]